MQIYWLWMWSSYDQISFWKNLSSSLQSQDSRISCQADSVLGTLTVGLFLSSSSAKVLLALARSAFYRQSLSILLTLSMNEAVQLLSNLIGGILQLIIRNQDMLPAYNNAFGERPCPPCQPCGPQNLVETIPAEVPASKMNQQYIKVERKVIDYIEQWVEETVQVPEIRYQQRTVKRTVPREKKVTDYYMVETITEFVPQVKNNREEMVQVTKTINKPRYIPVETQVVHYPPGLLQGIKNGSVVIQPAAMERLRRAQIGQNLNDRQIEQIKNSRTILQTFKAYSPQQGLTQPTSTMTYSGIPATTVSSQNGSYNLLSAQPTTFQAIKPAFGQSTTIPFNPTFNQTLKADGGSTYLAPPISKPSQSTYVNYNPTMIRQSGTNNLSALPASGSGTLNKQWTTPNIMQTIGLNMPT